MSNAFKKLAKDVAANIDIDKCIQVSEPDIDIDISLLEQELEDYFKGKGFPEPITELTSDSFIIIQPKKHLGSAHVVCSEIMAKISDVIVNLGDANIMRNK